MEAPIKKLHIENYKSIKQLDLDCKRINVFVGDPNVGKSNILEAINLNYLSFLFAEDKVKAIKIAQEIFRVTDIKSLFRNYSDNNPIVVQGNMDISISKNERNSYDYKVNSWDGYYVFGDGTMEFSNEFVPLNEVRFMPRFIRPYYYNANASFNNIGNWTELKPPYGENIVHVLESNVSLRSFFGEIVKSYGYEILVDRHNEALSIVRNEKNGFLFSVPFKAIADTLQRLIFYVSAIRSNEKNIVVFEEPEAHSFPPYVSMLADEIIQSSNQFFIATHSPYLLNNLIENTPAEDLAVFVCGYDKEEYQTTAKKLTSEQLSELLDYGVDIFFNIEKYVDGRF